MSPDPGLCGRCRHGRRVESGRGSVFWMCRVGQTDPGWPKYPPLPVRRCPHHVPAEAAEGDDADGG